MKAVTCTRPASESKEDRGQLLVPQQIDRAVTGHGFHQQQPSALVIVDDDVGHLALFVNNHPEV